MKRRTFLTAGSALLLSACATPPPEAVREHRKKLQKDKPLSEAN